MLGARFENSMEFHWNSIWNSTGIPPWNSSGIPYGIPSCECTFQKNTEIASLFVQHTHSINTTHRLAKMHSLCGLKAQIQCRSSSCKCRKKGQACIISASGMCSTCSCSDEKCHNFPAICLCHDAQYCHDFPGSVETTPNQRRRCTNITCRSLWHKDCSDSSFASSFAQGDPTAWQCPTCVPHIGEGNTSLEDEGDGNEFSEKDEGDGNEFSEKDEGDGGGVSADGADDVGYRQDDDSVLAWSQVKKSVSAQILFLTRLVEQDAFLAPLLAGPMGQWSTQDWIFLLAGGEKPFR
jgi:hypothetical protein